MIEQSEVVARIAGRPDQAGLFLDVDGTLAPIVARPELAQVLPEIPPILARLAKRLAVVAVISGRPSAQVRDMVDIEGVLVVGTHGLEDEPAMDAATLEEIREVAATVGAWVESKGAAAAVHFRGVEDPLAAATAAEPALAAVAAANGLEVLGGKRILELTPAGRRRKGGAVERVARDQGLEVVVFAGDDVGDLDAMRFVGLPVAVADAMPPVKRVAAYVTRAAGGAGAVREVCDLILAARTPGR